MRIDVKKYVFVGLKNALQTFFEKSQEIGLVDFIDARKLKVKEIPQEIQNVTNAIKVVRELPVLPQEEPDNMSESTLITDKILSLKREIEHLEEERRMLRLEIARVDVFGQFSLDDLRYLAEEGNRIVQFFFGKKGTSDLPDLSDNLIFVDSDHGLDYFVSISESATQYENLVEMKVDRELTALRTRLDEVKDDIHRMELKLKEFAKYNEFLHQALTIKYNDHHLHTAKSFAEDQVDGQVFAVEGWVPVNRVKELEDFLSDVDVHMAEIALDSDEVAPTYLENEGPNRIGEDLVHIYDTPSNTDKDPSLWVLASFAVFFAMIINDAGYGLLFLAGALYVRYKNGQFNKTGTRVWKLLVILFTSCMIWGLCTNSFFGMELAPDNSLKKVSVLNWLVEKKADYHFAKKDAVYKEWTVKYPETEKATNGKEFLNAATKGEGDSVSYEMANKFSDGILMELALLVGIIHVCLSFIRYLGRNWAGAGWIIAIIGSYLYFPLFLKATSLSSYVFGLDPKVSAEQGLYMIYGGLSLAVILGIIKDKWLGLLEITNLIQVFADILSYLRLYALGLAGAIISQTVNDIAGSLMFVFAVILLVIGHGLNMVLSIIGGVIHGLRLNFIEWYHYSFEGGGKLFNPLKKLETE